MKNSEGRGVYKEYEDVMSFKIDDMCKDEQLKGSYMNTMTEKSK